VSASRPVGGKDYPRNYKEFIEWFDSEDACREFLEKVRWPKGYWCVKCGGVEPWRTARHLYVCRECGHQSSVTAGTIMEKTRSPYRVWFHVMWQVAQSKNGVSALSLKNEIGFGSYETTWAWMHKLRKAMVRPEREKLKGRVEVDETFVGGLEKGVTGRETAKKSIVIVAVEYRKPKGAGRVRMARIPDTKKATLQAFVEANVEPGSTVMTDAWFGYRGLTAAGYDHEVFNVSKLPGTADEYLPLVHRVISLLKRWLLGTHQGSVRPYQLDYYLDEYTFRFNRRPSKSRGMLFYRLVQQVMTTEPAPYDTLVRGNSSRSPTSSTGST